MVLVLPILTVLIFGSFELGNYFWKEHVVEKGARDGARFASRQGFDKYTCADVDATVATAIKNVTRTGKPAGGTARVSGWTDADISITVVCDATVTTGIYRGGTSGAPVVTIKTSVAYPSLFGALGIDAASLTLNAEIAKRGDGRMKRPRLLADIAGSSAAEFALVLPLLLIFLFGIIDAGRAMWEWNRAEKATQMGARYAITTNLVPSGLGSYQFASTGGLVQGEPVPQANFPGVSCSSNGTTATCTCKAGGTCAFSLTGNQTAFNNLVARMNAFRPGIGASNVVIDYDYSGLGFAGDPNGPDVAPLVTVKLRNLVFTPITFLAFGGTITLPDFGATLSLEDGDGTVAN